MWRLMAWGSRFVLRRRLCSNSRARFQAQGPANFCFLLFFVSHLGVRWSDIWGVLIGANVLDTRGRESFDSVYL